MTKDIKRTLAWTFDKAFIIKSQKDVDSAIYLIEQAYNLFVKLTILNS